MIIISLFYKYKLIVNQKEISSNLP